MRISRTVLVIALALFAVGANASPDASEPSFFANDQFVREVIAGSPKDFIAGVVEVVTRCETATEKECLDRVRIVEIVAAPTPRGRSRSVGDTFLLVSGTSSPRDKSWSDTRFLILAVPMPTTTGQIAYGAKMMGEFPTDEEVKTFRATVDIVTGPQRL